MDGAVVQLSSVENFTLERFQPLLDFGTVQGARVLNFSVPITPQNDRIFGWLSNRQVKAKSVVLPAVLDEEGNILERGIVRVAEVKEKSYEIVFSAGFSDMFGVYADRKLSELDFGSEVYPASPSVAPVLGTAKYCMPSVDNDLGYGFDTYSNVMNRYVAGVYDTEARVPMLFVTKVLEMIGTLCGFKFVGSFMTDATIMRLILPNVTALDGPVNIIYNRHLPELTVKEFVLGLCSTFNVATWVNRFKSEIRLDLADGWFAAGYGGAEYAVPLDWSRKFAEIRQRSFTDGKRIQISWMIDSNDGLLKDAPDVFKPYVAAVDSDFDGGLFEVKSPFCPLDNQGAIPSMRMKLRSDTFGQTGEKCGARLAFWHGLVSGVPKAADYYGSKYLRLNTGNNNNISGGFFMNFEKFLLNTWMTNVRTKLNAYELAQLDMHRSNGALTQVYVQGNYYLIGKQRIQRNGIWSGELWRV